MRNSPVLDALFPKIRTKILAATVTRTGKQWYLSELAAFLHTRPSSLQREVDALGKAGILQQWHHGRRIYFKADPNCPVYPDRRNLFDKTAGLIPTVGQELEPFGDRIQLAFIYGSIARSEEESGSDIDLMIVGAVGLADLAPAVRRAERSLRRPVNPIVYSKAEFRRKVKGHDHFLTTVLKDIKHFVKGSEHDLEAIAG
jgi:predicted nucleotidyltransferase